MRTTSADTGSKQRMLVQIALALVVCETLRWDLRYRYNPIASGFVASTFGLDIAPWLVAWLAVDTGLRMGRRLRGEW